MSTTINRITNANAYMDGNSHFGQAEEVTLPVVKFKQAEHKALGMFGEMEYPSGIEKMEAKIKWNSLYPDVLKKMANPYRSISFQLRSSIDQFEAGNRAAQVPVVVYLTVRSKETPLGTFKAQDNVENENSLAVSYYKLEIAGEVITEVDVEANIWFVDGEDLLAEYRANLGI